MLESYSKHFCFVVQFLANCMRRASGEDPEAPGVVFLLGAGCSMQYGVPGFQELLLQIYADFTGMPSNSVAAWGQEKLRNDLEDLFGAWDPGSRRKAIRKTFPAVKGGDCPGYLRVARLRKYIRAVLNMNFDLLLEEACESLGEPATILYNFQETPLGAVYKIHGTVKEDGGEPIIGIDESQIFRDRREEDAVIDLLTKNHVVILGYSGVDEKILHALRTFQQPGYLGRTKLFVVNLSGPGNRLPHILRERKSEKFVLEGSEAGFENFMEGLEFAIEHPEDASRALERLNPAPLLLYSTQLEALAADQCRTLALNIRATINVAETGRVGIIEHGEELFESCLALAKSAGISLTSPEKYMILCAGYLHDLGYFLGYSSDRVSENPGWHLLKQHGRFTAELLWKYLDEEWRRRITPAGYSQPSRDLFVSTLIDLCRRHSLPPLEEDPAGPREIEIDNHGVRVRVRPHLLAALFATAEELAEGHPFFPSPDPIELDPEGRFWAMEDPILDLYLRQKRKELRHEIHPGRVLVDPENPSDGLSASAAWLLILASRAVKEFDRIAKQHGGQGVRFDCRFTDKLPVGEADADLIRNALKENLNSLLDQIRPGSPGESRSIVDLLSLYMLGHPEEPRLDAQDSSTLQGILRSRREQLLRHEASWQNALSLYFLVSRTGAASEMTRRFLRDFHEILYPAWRFCARSLQSGVNAICLSRLVFDLGSTPFRGEFSFALRHLASEKVKWDAEGERAYGHDECTLCTSRLLYIFSYARLVYQSHEPGSLPAGKRRGLDEIIQALLRTLLSKDPPRNWWGITKPSYTGGGGIHSADYAAWAVRALAFCLAVDQEIRAKTESSWLTNRPEVIALLEERLEDLCGSRPEAFLDNRSEEPHTYVVGDVALALLETERLLATCPDVPFDWRNRLGIARATLKVVTAELDGRNLSLISKLYLWPAKIFIHEGSSDVERESRESELLALHRQCSDSPIWIRGSEGSWGYNEENTQRLVSALNIFWRYAFEHRDLFERLFTLSEPPLRSDGEEQGDG